MNLKELYLRFRTWQLWRLVLCAAVWLFLLVFIVALTIMLPTVDDFDTVLVALLLLFLAAIPLAAGYWIGKKTARPQDTDIQQQEAT